VLQELVALACFFELRGQQALCDQFFRKPLAELAARDSRKFTNLLGLFITGILAEGGAPLIAMHAAEDWAGTSDERWDQILSQPIGEQDAIVEIWEWLKELDPEATQAKRLEGLLALLDFTRDPELCHERWLELCWADVTKAPENQRDELLLRMQFLFRIKPDAANSLRVWRQLSESRRSMQTSPYYIADLSAVERWAEAAEYFLKLTEQAKESKLDLPPRIHAYAASALRKAGREKEALAQDRLTEKLALGKEAGEIAMGYQYGADYTRAAMWWQRAVIQAEPESDEFEAALKQHLSHLIEHQDWQTAASLAEIQAQMAAVINTPVGPAIKQLRLRLTADFTRALATLKQDRAGSLVRLKECFELFPTDGSLADAFFPALLQTGLMPELETCYDRSWQAMKVAIEQYPEADNLLNTAAWLASRAQRNLPEAEKLLEKALALNPEQSSYLDTMAETHFAMGNRPKAVEWSRQSLNFLPKDAQISRQYERFKSSPLPPRRRR
jgi:tetratricopeptide (TPR) repeat protein